MSKYRKRNPFTESEKEVMWDRWRQGDSLHAIARLLGATHTSIRRNLLVTGGIQPPRRHRSRLALSLSEREEIKLPRELYKSLTWDRGTEMAEHTRFSVDTDIQVYFCDPKSPWQRGSNENTNGLLRQYFPKGMDLSQVHQNRLNVVARQLNERPRKTLNSETPAERFNQCVASTG